MLPSTSFRSVPIKNVTELGIHIFTELKNNKELPENTFQVYTKLIQAQQAEQFIEIMEQNLPPGQSKIIKNGLLTANKLGGFDEKGIPYLYLVTIAYLCNPNVQRREKVKLLKEKVQDEYTKSFLRKFCSLGMGSQYLSKAFGPEQHQELKEMIELISAIVNEQPVMSR